MVDDWRLVTDEDADPAPAADVRDDLAVPYLSSGVAPAGLIDSRRGGTVGSEEGVALGRTLPTSDLD